MELHITEIIKTTTGWLLTGIQQGTISNVSIDSRQATAGSLFVPLRGTRHDGHVFIGNAFEHGAYAALIKKDHKLLTSLKSTYPDKILISVNDPLQALGDIARYWRSKFDPQVVAITGSNGKTTAKEMAWNIIRRTHSSIKNPGNYNNLIGLPLSLFQLNSSHRVAILEMGMSGPGEIKRLAQISKPCIGLITNIGPSHLQQLNTLAAVKAAKAELFETLESSAVAIINNDDARVASLRGHTRAHVLSYGMTGGDIHATNFRNYNCCGTSFDLNVRGKKSPVHLKLLGKHLLSNALAAAAIADSLSIEIEDIVKGLESFNGVPGRMEVIDITGIRIINDAYNANPTSMQASLQALASITSDKRKIAVLGDMLELGSRSKDFHRSLGRTVARLHIDFLYLTGDFAAYVREGALAAGMNSKNIILRKDIKTLTKSLAKKVHTGDSILLKGSRKMKMERVLESLQQDQKQY